MDKTHRDNWLKALRDAPWKTQPNPNPGGVTVFQYLMSDIMPKEPELNAPCPICSEPGGFHDQQIHNRVEIPREFLKGKNWWKE